MRVGIDAHMIGTAAGGNETHYRNLLHWLPRVGTAGLEYVAYFTHRLKPEQESAYKADGYHVQYLGFRNSGLRVAFSLPAVARRDKLDILHAQYVLPPTKLPCKTVLTVADLAFEHYPEAFPFVQAWRCKLMIPPSARRADHIITVSEFSKQDIVERYGIDPAKITVTYHGVAEDFRPTEHDFARERIASKYRIEEPFLLYVGRIQARKNLVRVMEGLARLKREGSTTKFVIVGPRDFGAEEVDVAIARLGLQSDVIFPGYIPFEDLPLFFSACKVFVYPSFFEGFGLPVVEAMACGAPVITSQGSSLSEVAGDAAVMVDPHSHDSIYDALRSVLGNRDLQDGLRRAGLERVKSFSYEKAARQTADIYRSLS